MNQREAPPDVSAVAGPEGYSLSVPARPEYLATARLFAASVGRLLGSSEEQVEDLRLAVSEACTQAIAGGSTDRVTVELVPAGGSVTVQVGTLVGVEAGSIPYSLIEALFGCIVLRPAASGGMLVEFSFRPGGP
jgi:hypothetical protein